MIPNKLTFALSAALVAALLAAAAIADEKALPCGLDPAQGLDPFPSTYRRIAAPPLAIVGASIYTGTGAELAAGIVLVRDGRIESVVNDVRVPDGYAVVDAAGKWLTPGLIDAHSHLGVGAAPDIAAHDDTGETTDPNTGELWAEHSVWPQDPNFHLARAGGVTTMLILPGSDNLINGRSVTLKNVPATTVRAMKFPGAPYGLKLACGENPKGNYGKKGKTPGTRMGNVAGFRRAFLEAADYKRRWDDYHRKIGAGKPAEPPKRDLRLDSLAGVLEGRILVQNHCYRAEEMATMLDVAEELGFRIHAFHHASEAYKIADLLAAKGVCAVTWASAWGAKMESFDGIQENAGLVDAAGGCAVMHSDDPGLAQRLNLEAAEALGAARRLGLEVTKAQAIRWVTANPARALGIADATGTLEPGKMADLVLWSANPFSVYARPEKVWIDGALVFDRHDPRYQPRSDFAVGQPAAEELRR